MFSRRSISDAGSMNLSASANRTRDASTSALATLEPRRVRPADWITPIPCTSEGSENRPASSPITFRCASGSSMSSLSPPHVDASIMLRYTSPSAVTALASVTPLSRTSASLPSAAAASLDAIASTIATTRSSPGVPRMRTTSASLTSSVPEKSWSSRLSPSRIEPAAARATRNSASSSALTFSASQIFFRWSVICRVEMSRKSNRWQRERMVAGTFTGSVVEKMNLTCWGGSSRVFSSALKASLVSMWTSSM